MIREAASNGAQIIALPEMWNCPYSNDFFRAYSESENGETVGRMSELAKELSVYLIGGSIPELDDDRVYNTCFAFDREGHRVGYGGGYYDRYLARFGGLSLHLYAVAYDFQIVDHIETGEYDIPPHRIITSQNKHN